MDSRNSTLEILTGTQGLSDLGIPLLDQGQIMPATPKTYYSYVQPYLNGIPINPDLWSFYLGDVSAQLTLRFSIKHAYPFDVFLYIHLFRRPTLSIQIAPTPGFPSLLFGNYITERIHTEYFMGFDTQTKPYLLWMASPNNTK